MVRIINFKEHQREDGTTFCLLELQGGVEMVQSQATGNFYATAKKAWVSSTFDEVTCQALIGSEIPGKVVKQEVEPYTYVVKETGEELVLTHRWVYIPEETSTTKEDKAVKQLIAETSNFSKNGEPELEEQFM